MSDDQGSPHERTVFRPSPLGARAAQGALAPPPVERPPSGQLAQDEFTGPAVPVRFRNAMMAKAEKLLALLASVRAGRAKIELPRLYGVISAGIGEFTNEMKTAYPEEHVKRATYALCAAADDVALNIPDQSQHSAEWARRSMAVRYFGESIGGDRFWTLLEQMISRADEFSDVLEIYHACMACGFEGRYRVLPNGKAEHQEMMQRAYAALRHPRTLSAKELAPHWRGQPTETRTMNLWTPLVLASEIGTLLLVLIYFVLRLQLAQFSGPVIASVNAINPEQPLELARPAPPPPAAPQSTLLERVSQFLAPEVQAHQLEIFEDSSTVRIRSLLTEQFRSGAAELDPKDIGLYQKVAAAVDKEKGPISVEGFTDSEMIHSLTFPDNVALAQARAETVAGLLKGAMADASRVSATGFGNAQPIASNATPAGRARNRRVEIAIQRE